MRGLPEPDAGLVVQGAHAPDLLAAATGQTEKQAMTQEQERKLDEVAEKVGAIHTTLFGAEGQGGLHRRVEVLERHKEDINTFKAKLLGMVTLVCFLASAAGSKFITWIKGN